jgi:hypothetical protein
MSIRKERYWLRNRELIHGAKMYVMPQLGVRISWRERCKPGPRHQDLLFLRHTCLTHLRMKVCSSIQTLQTEYRTTDYSSVALSLQVFSYCPEGVHLPTVSL